MRWIVFLAIVVGIALLCSGYVKIPPGAVSSFWSFIQGSSSSSPGMPSSENSSTATTISNGLTNYHVHGVSFNAASDWTEGAEPGAEFGIHTEGKAFQVFTSPKFLNVDFDSAAFSNQLLSKSFFFGLKLKAESREPFHGRPAYSAIFSKEGNGDAVYTHAVIFKTGNSLYFLMARKRNADPTRDPQLIAILDSVKIDDL